MTAKTIQRGALESSGYLGLALILGAYFLVSFNIISAQSAIFQLMNLVGAAGNITYYLFKKAYSGVILDIFWAIVAVLALMRLIFFR